MQPVPISQTLIKEFETYGYCPRKIYVRFVARTHEQAPTESMVKGQYFETLVLGSGRDGIQVTDLARRRNGQPTADHTRIDLQAKHFPEVLEKYGIGMPKPHGRQLAITTEVNGIAISGNLDFVSPVIYQNTKYPVGIIDLKLTRDRENDFGPFCWGTPENMDKLQGIMYPFLFKKKYADKLPKDYVAPFFFLVFDYKPKYGEKLIPVEYNKEEEEKLIERITLAYEKMQEAARSDWPAQPDYMQCKNCPLKLSGECKEAPEIMDINIEEEIINMDW